MRTMGVAREEQIRLDERRGGVWLMTRTVLRSCENGLAVRTLLREDCEKNLRICRICSVGGGTVISRTVAWMMLWDDL